METIPHSLSIPEGAWFDLTGDRALFCLSGPDRARFLNGQVTNNVDVDLSRKSIPACLCSLKGKVEALVWITADNDNEVILIDGELSQREQIFGRLDRYLIADDCELEDVTGDWRLVHQVGEADGRAANRLGIAGVDLWMKTGDAPDLDPESELSAIDWEKLSVLSGIPMAENEITGNEFPSELRLDKWAVDFRKGCYLGQEIISRIESVGQTRKTLFLLETEEPLEKAEEVIGSGIKIGIVTRKSVQLGERAWITSALLKTDLLDSLLTDSEKDQLKVFLPKSRI